MNSQKSLSFFWFRRDLRLHDNAGLYHALKNDSEVIPVFIFDKNILEKLDDKNDARVEFIYNTVVGIKKDLSTLGSNLIVEYGKPLEVWKKLISEYQPDRILSNRDYEPYAKKRDQEIAEYAESNDIVFEQYKDHVIFEKPEVLKADGTPYTVFTPYKRRWLQHLNTRVSQDMSYFFKPYPTEKYFGAFAQKLSCDMPSLESMNFTTSTIPIPEKSTKRSVIKNYDKNRDFPAVNGTSKLGIHYRFGTVSIREKAYKAQGLNQVYLSELVWRDFYAMILDAFPHVAENSFRSKYDKIPWRFDEFEFQSWCDGKTGYPMVDAGMRELNLTGHMHNRVRMVVASFLTKHLLIDWRLGEAYFAKKLLDFDLASNNGGWQWAAGCGTDAAPYFRIFNPTSQQKKFDKNFEYIKKWIPEFETEDYPGPIVDHKEARERCLRVYKEALS